MNFSHCDHDEQFLTLHDCIAERAYMEDGKLVFEFDDGFLISPKHPESDLEQVVRTDFSKVEYVLYDGKYFDSYVYVFKKNLFGQIVRYYLTIQELLDKINNHGYKVEFKYQYIDEHTRYIECDIHLNKRPYRMECLIWICGPEEGEKVNYLWNNLRENRPW